MPCSAQALGNPCVHAWILARCLVCVLLACARRGATRVVVRGQEVSQRSQSLYGLSSTYWPALSPLHGTAAAVDAACIPGMHCVNGVNGYTLPVCMQLDHDVS